MKTKSVSSRMDSSCAWPRWLVLVPLVILFAALAPVTASSAPPSLTVTNAVTVPEDDTANLAFMVSDSDSPLFTVSVTARSSDTNLIGSSGLVFSGFGASRVLAITPRPHRYGSATITLVATDDQVERSTNTFTLTVPFVNMLPGFASSIVDKTIKEDARATNYSFAINDYETAAASLTVPRCLMDK